MSKFSTALTGVKTFAKAPLSNPKTGKAILLARKHAPEIMVYSGVVGMVGTTVLACKEIFEVQHTAFMASGERIKMKNFAEANPDSEEARTYKRELTKSYSRQGLTHIRQMAPALSLGALSIASILAGHNMLRKRHVALAGAYVTLQNTYDEYRDAVKDFIGEDTERELRQNLVVGEDKLKENKPLSEQVSPSNFSPYARIFDESNKNWMDDTTYNEFFLRNIQNTMNDQLRARGYVFLSDVYKELGLPASRWAHTVGWIYDNPNGDGFIDFGVWDKENERARDFVNGFEKAIWLDFNVDGPILELLNMKDF